MANKAVFWDRDGTLLKHHDYLTKVEEVELMRGAAGAIKYLSDRGYKNVVITNQSAIARGLLTEQGLAEIHKKMNSLLVRGSATIDKIYYCPYHPEGAVEKYRQESELRKPEPGMLKLAAEELELDLEQCWMIGDDDRDILAGQAAGCRTIMIKDQSSELVRRGESKPDYIAGSPQEAANIVAHYGKQSKTEPEEEDGDKKPGSEPGSDPEAEPNGGTTKPVSEVKIPVGGASKAVDEAEAEKNGNTSEGNSENNGDDAAGCEVLVPEGEQDEPVHVSKVRNTPRSENKHHDMSGEIEESGNTGKSIATEQDRPASTERRSSDTNILLQEVLRELKRHNIREEDAKAEFSGASLLAGITQIIVILCLVMAYVATGGTETNYDKLQSWLLGGLIFQTMTIALLMMNK